MSAFVGHVKLPFMDGHIWTHTSENQNLRREKWRYQFSLGLLLLYRKCGPTEYTV